MDGRTQLEYAIGPPEQEWRMDIQAEPLTAGKLAGESEPFETFNAWFEEARAREMNDPEAMALSTVDAEGMPNIRMVLMKAHDEKGFVFYTNAQSAKGRELLGARKAGALFHWKSLRRQVRIRGLIEEVTIEESDAYFASRPRDSRIGAWASRQSEPMETRFDLEKAVARYAAKFAVGEVPRPAHWHGFRIRPVQIEFWRDKPFRLHERIDYRRAQPQGEWTVARLFP
jgi:pyridoxamine 5'-phosphate oxidase